MDSFIFKSLKNVNQRQYLLLIYFVWLTSLLIFFFFSEFIKAGALEGGVKLGNDSKFYLREAENIINGNISILKYKSKFGYLLFLYPFLLFDLPLFSVVVSQIFITSVAAFCLYKITERYFCKFSGLICIGLFLFYFPLQLRNFYILTEILYIDISIILLFLIVFFKRSYLPIIIILLLFLISIRPNGILFLFSILISLLFLLVTKKRYLYLVTYLVFASILFIPVINFLNAYLQDLNLIQSLNKGIIWGYSFETGKVCESYCLSIKLINNNFSSNLLGYFEFVVFNFAEYFKIFFYKIFWMIIRIRPYYSDLHNLYIAIFNLLIFAPFVYGIYKKPKNLNSVNILIIYILLSTFLVGLTFADWSGRFSLYILPFIMIFSSYGILIFVKKVLKMVD